MRRAAAGGGDAPGRLAGSRCGRAGRGGHPARRRCDEASGRLPAGAFAGGDLRPGRGRPDPPRRGGRYRGGCCVRRTGQCTGRTGRRSCRSRAAPVGRQRGKVSHRALFAGLRRLGHCGAAAGGKRAGHGAPGRAVRHRYQPDDPAQERDGHSGRQRPPGKGKTGRVRPLCAAHPL